MKEYNVTNTGYGTVYSGGFGILTDTEENTGKIVDWHSCRETFCLWFYNKLYKSETKFPFLVTHAPDNGKQVVAFLQEVENRLDLKERSQFFYDKNDNKITIVKPSPWWLDNYMRIQFLSVLLRCANNYKGDFEKALYSIEYASHTKAAIEKFFSGFTKWGGTQNTRTDSNHEEKEMTWKWGWVKFFEGGANLDLMIK
jgi:hypothetical protein